MYLVLTIVITIIQKKSIKIKKPFFLQKGFKKNLNLKFKS